MAQLVPYNPLPPEVNAAIDTLNRGDTFDAAAFAIASAERWRRAFIFLAYAVPIGAVGAGLVWLARDWLGILTTPLYAFFPIILAALACNALRGETFKEELRLGRAIARWEERGGRIRERPLEPKA